MPFDNAVFEEADRTTRSLSEQRALAPRPGAVGAWERLEPTIENVPAMLDRLAACTTGGDAALNASALADRLRVLAHKLRGYFVEAGYVF